MIFELDYDNLIKSVQCHTKWNSGSCLRLKDRQQKCGFNLPQELCNVTDVKCEKIQLKNYDCDNRAIKVSKRDNSRANKHQQLQLQSWRVNCDLELVIDH